MDKITESLLRTFVSESSIKSKDQTVQFEHFATYSTLAGKLYEEFSTEDMVVGHDSTPGIDAVAIIVNGSAITDEDELRGILDLGGTLEVDFHFIQAKTSPHFTGAVVIDFADEVAAFFAEEPDTLHANLQPFRKITDAVMELGLRLKRNPNCFLYYVSAGSWNDDVNLKKKFATAKQRLDALNFFDYTEVSPVDARSLQKLYRATKNKRSANFVFANRSTISNVEGVSQAFLGTLPGSEFIKIIADDTGELHRGIFEDNVRDFQGTENAVNEKIAQSVLEHPDRFAVLNNGVTLVATTGTVLGDSFELDDFQIVNGCQTANVLYSLKDEAILQNLAVPLRVVITEDEVIANSITAATNSQTQVRSEELYSLLSFQRSLEQFFATFDSPKDLYFERRSKQYQSAPSVPRNRIVTRAQMVKAFASTFLGEPHRATGYYTTLYNDLDSRLFIEDHRLEGYYAAAVAQFRLEALLRAGAIGSALRPARYQMLHAARHLAMGEHLDALNSKSHGKKVESLANILWDEKASLALFEAAGSVVKSAAGSTEISRDFTKRQSVTRDVAAKAAEARAQAGAAIWRL